MQIESRLPGELRWRSGLLVLLLLAIPCQSALAICPIEEWIQEEAAVAVDGREAFDMEIAFVQGDEEDDGIGGTGISPNSGDDEDGIGGSGIFGTITGFGSLCVNGGGLVYSADVAVTMNGQSIELEELAVGQVIRAETLRQSADLQALAIDVQHELVGPVSAIAEDFVEVMGERVSLGEFQDGFRGEVSEGFALGRRLAVSGLRRPDGRLVVSRIDTAPEEGVDLLRGEWLEDEAGQARVGAVLLAPSPAASNERSGGGRQLVLGHWDGEARHFEVLRSSSSPRTTRTTSVGAKVDLEGYVTRITDGEFRVGDLRFQVESGLETAPLEIGDRVRVRGRWGEGNRALRVISIQRIPERGLLRSLDRVRRAPNPMPTRVEGPARPPGQDVRRRSTRMDAIDRHRPPTRPDRPVRPQPRHDLIERRRLIDSM